MMLSMSRRRVEGEKNITMSRSLGRLSIDRKWTVEMESYFGVAIGGAMGIRARYWCRASLFGLWVRHSPGARW
jgi:hypothetical protein